MDVTGNLAPQNIGYLGLHNHTNGSEYRDKFANMNASETLKYYQEIGADTGKTAVVGITDHDNVFGGINALNEWKSNPDKYKNVVVVPGVEFNTRLNGALTYDIANDYRCVFKKMHVLVYPDCNHYEEWKNCEEFKTYSKLCTMFKTEQGPNGERTANTGAQVLGLRNLIKDKLKVNIPLEELAICADENATHLEIRERFLHIACKHLRESNNVDFAGKTNIDIIKTLDTPIFKVSDENRNILKDEILINSINIINDMTKGEVVKHEITKGIELLSSAEEVNDFVYDYVYNLLSNDVNNDKELLKQIISNIAIPNEFKLQNYKKVMAKNVKSAYGDKLNPIIIKKVVEPVWQKSKTNEELKEDFIKTVAPILVENINGFNIGNEKHLDKAKIKIENNIFSNRDKATFTKLSTVFPNKVKTITIENGYQEIDIIEEAKIAKKAHAHICLAHFDSGFDLHENVKIPVGAFKGVDLSFIKNSDCKTILENMLSSNDIDDKFVNSDILKDDEFDLVKLGLLCVNSKRNGINIEGIEIDRNILHNKEKLNATLKFCKIYDLKPSFGVDIHMNKLHQNVLDWQKGKITKDELGSLAQDYYNNDLLCSGDMCDFVVPSKSIPHYEFKNVKNTPELHDKMGKLKKETSYHYIDDVKECGFLDMLYDIESTKDFVVKDGGSIKLSDYNKNFKPILKCLKKVKPAENINLKNSSFTSSTKNNNEICNESNITKNSKTIDLKNCIYTNTINICSKNDEEEMER